MSMDDNAYWLALHRAPALGLALEAVFARFEHPEAIFHAPSAELAALGVHSNAIHYLTNPDWESVKRDRDWLEHHQWSVVTYTSEYYPAELKRIADPPAVLFVFGDPELLLMPQLAIVGSRSPSTGGFENSYEFAAHLAKCGLAINSGLAQGVDMAAHQGALDSQGATIAVMGTGPDRVYPAKHRELANRIAKEGVLVTEFLPGIPVRKGNFPKRNRLISGMSLGVLVVEATLRSGSLITARHALEQSREVFAIPGSIHNPMSKGCHSLIRQGAKLVDSVEHVLEEIGPILGKKVAPQSADAGAQEKESFLTDDYQLLLEQMGWDPVSIDQLVDRSGLTAEAVSSMLLSLELQDKVALSSSGKYQRSN